MKTKIVNWNSKVNKYTSLEKLSKFQPGYKWEDAADNEVYWDYYLNYISEARVNGTENNTDTVGEFKSIKSFRQSFKDTNPDAGTLVGKTNLLNPSITKVMKCPSDPAQTIFSGFRMETKSTYHPNKARFFDTIIIQLNKLDKAYIDSLATASFRFDFVIKEDDGNSNTPTNATGIRIVFTKGLEKTYPTRNDDLLEDPGYIESITVDGNTHQCAFPKILRTNHFNLEEGLFVIDAELLKYFGLDKLNYVNTEESGKTFHYSFSFYKIQSGTPIELEVANVCFTNSFELLLDETIKLSRDNLTVFNRSKKTGVAFPDINEYEKTIEASVSLYTLEEIINMDLNILKNNMNSPFYVLPFAEPSEDLTLEETKDNQQTNLYRIKNLQFGGLFYFDPALDISSPNWDNYNIKLKMLEYK